MSVELDPPELGFRRPFTTEVSEILRLRNPHNDPVAFKVKTTAPKQYCVRPNSGRIEPGQYVEVSVLLQAMKEDPPMDAKCRDKFLVQSVAVSADQELPNVTAIWNNIEQTAKSSIQEKKIRVNFLPADGSMSTPVRHSTNGPMSHDQEPPSYGSPMSMASTPQHHFTAAHVSPSPYSESRSVGNSNLNHEFEQTNNEATAGEQSLLGAAVSSIAAAVPSSDDIHAQLESAKATIARMTSQTQEQGLRQRKSDAVTQDSKGRISSGTARMGVPQGSPTGVPVPIVAALCLLSFLLAYLLF